MSLRLDLPEHKAKNVLVKSMTCACLHGSNDGRVWFFEGRFFLQTCVLQFDVVHRDDDINIETKTVLQGISDSRKV